MSTVAEIVALGVGGEIAKGLRAGTKFITLEDMDLIHALAEAYERGLRKGEQLERTTAANDILQEFWAELKEKRRDLLYLGNDASFVILLGDLLRKHYSSGVTK